MTTDAEHLTFLHELIAQRIENPYLDTMRPVIDHANEDDDNPPLMLVVMNGLLIAELAKLLAETYGLEEGARRMRTVGIGLEIEAIFNPVGRGGARPDPVGQVSGPVSASDLGSPLAGNVRSAQASAAIGDGDEQSPLTEDEKS
jgi:hypothetical protein